MLVLTRKRNEMIRIGDDVVVKVIKTAKGAVKIGIEAPAHVRVLRGELTVFEETAEAVGEEEVEAEPEAAPTWVYHAV